MPVLGGDVDQAVDATAKHWALSGCDVSAQEANVAGLLAAVAGSEDQDTVLNACVATLARHSNLALRLLKAGIDPTPELAPRDRLPRAGVSGVARRREQLYLS